MSRRPSPNPRKLIPIKLPEGEPLYRRHLQYDFLHNIFSDTTTVFTDPWPTSGDPTRAKLTFRNLYIKTILNSTKSTKAFREKLADMDIFAEDFAMIALLVNVGRINTTLSFLPEMKTAIRSYHPVPALQRTSETLLDAPRIKHMLKAVSVEGEVNPPSNIPSPSDILSRLESGRVPPISVTHLIFSLANHSQAVGHSHLPDNVDFLDLFMKEDLSSESRAKAFLWLCYSYLERPATDTEDNYDIDVIANPFGDPRKDGKPTFVHLSLEEAASENIDPPEELELAKKLIEDRTNLVQTQQLKDKSTLPSNASGSVIGDADDTPGSGGEEIGTVSTKGKKKRENPPTAKKSRTTTKERKSASSAGDKMVKSRKQRGAKSAATDGPPDGSESATGRAATRQRVIDVQNQYPSQGASPNHHQSSVNPGTTPGHRYTPYQREYISLRQSSEIYQAARSRHPVTPRSFLQHAWIKVTTVDPLADSDDDDDEYSRHDYMQRLRVIAGILGTPFSDSGQPPSSPVQPSVQLESASQPGYV